MFHRGPSHHALIFLAALGLIAPSSARAQDRPDFSGRWVLESSSTGSNAPATLIVRHAKTITIEREFSTGPTRETHEIGLMGGFVSGGVGASGNQDQRRSSHSVRWEDRTLVFEQGSQVDSRTGPAEWSERREEWSVVENGRLRVTITTKSSVFDARTTTAIYRR